ncbi:MAG: hypothetical protein ACK4F9_03140 [Brevinematia bacterium]
MIETIEFIEKNEILPPKLKQKYRDIDGFIYKESKLFVGRISGEDIGAVRVAIRDDSRRKYGLISDLNISESVNFLEVANHFIEFAENYLLSNSVTKIDAIVPEGKKLNYAFYDKGYWASRKLVAIGWDLENLNFSIEQSPPNYKFDIVLAKDFSENFIKEISEFVFNSYQPYFRWWKEYKEDYRWWRTEYLDKNIPEIENELKEEMINRIIDYLYEIKEKNSAIVIGLVDNKLKGICDVVVDEEENMLIGVAVDKDFKVKHFGSNILFRALNFLKSNNLKTARTITTSGLDDYDPTVYLYTLSGKGQILSEYTVLIKRNFSQNQTENIIDIGQPLEF